MGRCASAPASCAAAWASAAGRNLYLPRAGEFIGYWRLRDWLRLLGLRGRGRPLRLLAAAAAHDKLAGALRLDGPRGRPLVAGAGCGVFLVAVKRVRGMRLVGLARSETPQGRMAAPRRLVANRASAMAAPVPTAELES